MSSHDTTQPGAVPHRDSGRGLPRVAVVGAVAASLIGFTTVTADAASEATWDRVAQCESGGVWSINTGNGYYGGLQFAHSTWKSHGGKGYAHQASKAEQIRIAEKVLRSQGPGAWPVCGRKAGLARGSSGAVHTRTAKSKPSRKDESSASPRAATTPVRAARSTRATDSGDVVVRPGDTLSGIAATHNLPGGWHALYDKNRTVVGRDPDLIYPGQRLSLPS